MAIFGPFLPAVTPPAGAQRVALAWSLFYCRLALLLPRVPPPFLPAPAFSTSCNVRGAPAPTPPHRWNLRQHALCRALSTRSIAISPEGIFRFTSSFHSNTNNEASDASLPPAYPGTSACTRGEHGPSTEPPPASAHGGASLRLSSCVTHAKSRTVEPLPPRPSKPVSEDCSGSSGGLSAASSRRQPNSQVLLPARPGLPRPGQHAQERARREAWRQQGSPRRREAAPRRGRLRRCHLGSRRSRRLCSPLAAPTKAATSRPLWRTAGRRGCHSKGR
jgi:hypothetical protein